MRARAQYLGGSPRQEPPVPRPIDGHGDVVQQLLQVPPPPLVIESGDELSVEVFEIEHYKYNVRVGTDGTISLPLLDAVDVHGLTPDETERRLASKLEQDGMVRKPHLHVVFLQAPTRDYTVAGNVQKPGVFPSFGSHTLTGAIAAAGGLTDQASSNVTLLRPGTLGGYTLNLGNDPARSPAGNIPIYRGDTIIAGAVGVIYVVGGVKNTGVYKLKPSSPTTVSQALATAGGIGFEGERDHVMIVRVVDGAAIDIPLHLSSDSTKPQDLTILQPDDIVFVPTSSTRAAIKAGAVSVAVVLASSALYKF